MERMMKIQEVVLKAMAGKLKWWEAAEIIGVTDRTMRRWRERYQEHGYSGLWDHRKRSPSPKRIPEAGLVERRKKRGSHRKRRERRSLTGMMLHIDASEHGWFQEGRKYELIVI